MARVRVFKGIEHHFAGTFLNIENALATKERFQSAGYKVRIDPRGARGQKYWTVWFSSEGPGKRQ